MNAKPYVGVTGPVSVSETQAICKEFAKAGYSMATPHIPMLGFLVSHKTLNGQATANRRYPSFDSLPDLLRATKGSVLTMVHYNTKEMETLADQVSAVFDGVYDNGLCKALQLNLVWPDIYQVARIKEKHPDMQIVFQASHKAMADKTPTQIAQGIRSYADLLDYVLIDPSGGRGLAFELESSISLYFALKEHCPSLTIGFAGGFTGENVGPRTMQIIQRIFTEGFCIDAEGGLRDKITNEYGDDLLNIKKVRTYLQMAGIVLK